MTERPTFPNAATNWTEPPTIVGIIDLVDPTEASPSTTEQDAVLEWDEDAPPDGTD